MTVLPTDTLSALQAVLDNLGTGQALRLTNTDCDGLFGVGDALIETAESVSIDEVLAATEAELVITEPDSD